MAINELSAQAAAQLGNMLGGSKSFGPLTVTYDLDISVPQITASASLYGVSIGHVVINKDNPSATLGGDVGIAKAELELTVDFDAKEVDYSVDVSAVVTIYKGSGKLFTW